MTRPIRPLALRPALLLLLLLLLVLLLLVPAALRAQEAPSRLFPAPRPDVPGADLVIYTTTDTAVFAPVIDAFQARHPNIGVAYHDLQSVEIFDRVREETEAGGTTADMVLSSAMDLQFKLANDGYAEPLDLSAGDYLPRWASWRDTVFGVTFEPAVIVYNKPFFAAHGLEPPATRAGLAALLRDHQDALHGRIATYDIERSGVGFQFLAWDARHDPALWELVALMGQAGVRLYTNSAAIIDRVAQGRFVLGYNILGSYAGAMAASRPDLGIVLPQDYTLVLSRLGLVPRAAARPELGRLFLEFLLSEEGQRVIAEATGLGALHPAVEGPGTAGTLTRELGQRFRPIRVGPGLLAFLDQAKRRQVLRRWNDSLVDP